jgi:gluconate 2-dehydrogenase alpha chain
MIRMGTYPGGGPKFFDRDVGIVTLLGATAMGSQFKAGLKDYYLPTKTKVVISLDGPELPDKRWYFDLDPTYTDWYGDPVARWTYNFGPNSYNAAQYLSGSSSSPGAKILEELGCTDISIDPGVAAGQVPMDTYTAHIRGGCRMGTDPATSAVNKYGQLWENENAFTGGEITDTTGDNTTIGGTHPMGAALYVQAEGIKMYLENPGPLV